MPRGMSEDVSQVIVHALSRGLSRGQISGVVGVSKRAITRINTNLKKHGTPKAPPSGIKLGRPSKMTPEQAQAMLGWMAERDYTFYVKDLVQFLRQNYDYVGCDGTVRRGLIKAGFKRKLPWHKSEVSVWLPPEIPILPLDDMHHSTTARSSQNIPEDGIDPNLEHATLHSGAMSQATAGDQTLHYQHELRPQARTAHLGTHQLLPTPSPSFHDPNSSPPHDLYNHPASSAPIPTQLSEPPASTGPPPTTTTAAASHRRPNHAPKPASVAKPKKKPRRLPLPAELPVDFVTQLQRQLLEQKEEIAQLHRQLQAHQQHPLPHQFLTPTPQVQRQHGAVAEEYHSSYDDDYDDADDDDDDEVDEVDEV